MRILLKLFAASALFLIVSPSAKAQTVFSDDFEIGNLSWWQETELSGGAQIRVVKVSAHSGKAAVAITGRAGAEVSTGLIRSRFSAAANPVYARFYFYIDPNFAVPAGDSTRIASLINFTSYDRYPIELRNSGTQLLLTSQFTGDGRRGVSKGRWHALEIQFRSGHPGTFALYLDGTLEVRAAPSSLGAIDGLELGLTCGYGNGGTILYDDVMASAAPIGAPPASITVRHGSTFARTDLKLDIAMWGQSPLDQLVILLDGKEVLPTRTGLMGWETAMVPFSALAPGEHKLDMELVGSDGNQKASASETIVKYGPPGIPTVAIDGNNNILASGSKVFPVVPFVENSDSANDLLTHSVTNLNGWNSGWSSAYSSSQYRDYVSSVAAPTIGPNSRFAGFGKTRADENSSIAEYTSHLASQRNIFGWTWCDEPDLGAVPDIPASVVKNWTDISHAHDSSHPVFLNLYGYAPSNSRKNGFVYPNLVADVYSFDIYPVISQSTPSACEGLLSQNATFGGCRVSMAQFVDAIDTWVSYNYDLTPWMVFIEFGDQSYTDSSRAPTSAELRMELWLAVIHGAKGISWWPPTSGWGRIPQENRREAEAFVHDMGQLTDVILADPSPLTVSTNRSTPGARVDATVREARGDTWIIAQRLTDFGEAGMGDLDTRFSVAGLTGSTIATVYGENRTIPVIDGVFVDLFAPYARHIYQVKGEHHPIIHYPHPHPRPSAAASAQGPQ